MSDFDESEERRRYLIKRAYEVALETGHAVEIVSGICVHLPHPEAVMVPDLVVIERHAHGLGHGPGPEQKRSDADGRTVWMYAEGVPA